MKKIPYTNGVKALIICFHGLVSILVTVCFFLMAFLFRDNIIQLEDVGSQKYEESAYFLTQFETASDELQQLIQLKSLFETKGSYDSSKLVSVGRYNYQKEVSTYIQGEKNKKEKSMAGDLKYPVDTLETWAQDGYETVPYACNVELVIRDGELCQSGNLYIDNQKIEIPEKQVTTVGELNVEIYDKLVILLENQGSDYAMELSDDQEIMPLLQDLNMERIACRNHAKIIKEAYEPQDGANLKLMVTKGTLSIAAAEKLSDQLIEVLDDITDDIKEYKRLHSTYETDKTNFLFWIYNTDTQAIYTNCQDIERVYVEKYAKKTGRYLYWNSEEVIFESNINGIGDYFYNQTGQLENYGTKAEVMLAVNTKYPYGDIFLDAQEEYQCLCPWLKWSILLAIVGILSWIVCILFLTAASGRNDQDEEIHLCWLDRVKTEIILAGCICFFVLMVYLYVRLALGNMWEVPGIFIMAGTLTFVGYSGFITGYLSLVRRIKCRTLWTGSLACCLVDIVSRLMAKRSLSLRLLLIYGIHASTTLFLAYLTFSRKSVLWLGVLLIYMVLEGTYYVKEVLQKRNIVSGIEQITGGDLDFKIDTEGYFNVNRKLGEGINRIGEGLQNAVDESMKNERMKADLITNVSHDIKTPLTSIINYANLIQLEDIQNDKVNSYVNILVDKSQRLKQLTEDLVEASKISSGNITLHMTRIDFVELVYQTAGEFNEKFERSCP